MQEGQARGALKKGNDRGLFVEALLIELPGLKGRSGHLKLVGGLTLRQALILQLTVLFKQAGPFEPIPASLASIVALGLGLHYGSHGDLLNQAFAF
jgi:hypothetical protein